MKTVKVTLTRLYKKEVVIEIDKDLIKDIPAEKIDDFLWNEYAIGDADEQFEEAELEGIDFPDNHGYIDADTDRYDVYDENGKQIYGGHL